MLRLRDAIVVAMGIGAAYSATHYFRLSQNEAEAEYGPILTKPSAVLASAEAAPIPSRSIASTPTTPVDTQETDLKAYRDLLPRYPEASTCEAFKTLADKENFRLRDMAKLRSLVVCPEKAEVDWLEFSKPHFDPLRSEAEMVIAEKQEKWDVYLELLHDSVAGLRTESEKIKALQKGIQIAKAKKQKAQIAKLTDLLEKVAPRLKKNIQRADFFDVGKDYISAREFDKGRTYLKKVFGDARFSMELRRKAFASYRNSFKVEQDKRQHLKEAQKYYQWLLKHKEWNSALDAGLYVARALWTEGLQSQAEKILDEVEKKLDKKTKTFDVDYIRGRMASEDANHQKSIQHYEQALAKGAKSSNILGYKAQYAKAWALYHLNKLDEAAKEFSAAYDLAKEQPDQIRARYWQARSLKKNGKDEEAKVLFKEIMDNDPLGFYGLIAYRDNDIPIPAVTAVAAEAKKKAGNESEETLEAKYLTPELRQLIADLSFVGEKKALESILNDISQKGTWDWESPEGFELLRYYAKAGLYLPLFSILTKIPKEQREHLLLVHPELLFPQDYAELIGAAAQKESIPAELVFAIIRQESAFDPFARSHADAMGLMQIIPDQAKNIAKTLEISLDHHDGLYSPELNIPIGTRLLKQGLDRYKGNLVLAVASYNANDRAIRNWLRTRFRDDPLEFVEEIPYEETRAYVKLVLRNYVFYKRLKNPSQAMTFPNECLTNLQNFKTSTEKSVVSQ